MRKVILLFNPESGGKRRRHADLVEAAATELRVGGVEAEVAPTREPGSAELQAQEAIAAGYDTVLACGGDGTVHEALQGIVGTQAALGVIPLGTGNALANDLRLPRSAAAAARRLLGYAPRPVAVGRIQFQQISGGAAFRYFLVAAGVGPDAQLAYRMALAFKRHLGMSAYYAEATRQWLTWRYPPFSVEVCESSGDELRRETATQVLAVRITEFGGLLRQLAPGAALGRPDFRLVIFKTRRRLSYLNYMVRVMLGGKWAVPGVELVHCNRVVCRPLHSAAVDRIYAEADGELLGVMPVEISVAPETVNLLMPAKS